MNLIVKYNIYLIYKTLKLWLVNVSVAVKRVVKALVRRVSNYHDYCELLKAWFGDNIDTKIVESAINFWFKDNDYKSGGSKVYKYFRGA